MTDAESPQKSSSLSTALSSTQLNIVSIIDMAKILRTNSLENCVSMMDNSSESLNKGTPQLTTVCRQGQTLNWLMYCMDMRQRPDGSWPPMARIANIAFIKEGGTTRVLKTCNDLKIYGGPDAMRSPYVPSYIYWAGTIKPDLGPGLYRYRLVIECETGEPNKKKYLDLDGPALRVIPMNAECFESHSA